MTVPRDDVEPGSEAQIDYGFLGQWVNPGTGKRHRIWAFVMVLPCSRHMFVRPVVHMDQHAWTQAHVEAFRFFGGVPRRLVPDNLRTGVDKSDLYDPKINKSYAELATYYGTLVDPARASHPKDKPRVERPMPYVRDSFWSGRQFTSIEHMQAEALTWAKNVAGGRHCRPLEGAAPMAVFEAVEAQALLPLPQAPFVLARWSTATVGPDIHIKVGRTLYSVSWKLIGRRVDVRSTATMVQVFHESELVKTHAALDQGKRTDKSDYPPEKIAFQMKTPIWCRGLPPRSRGPVRRRHPHPDRGRTPPRPGPRRRSGDRAMSVMDTALRDSLKVLRLSGMLETLDARLAQAHGGELGHLDFLQVLCQDEITRRETVAFQRRLQKAKFEQQVTLEEFDFAASPKLPAAQIRDLAALRWLHARESVILFGPVGVGKTHVAQALGHLAIRLGVNVRFAKTSRVLAELAGGHADRTWDKRMRELIRPDARILDDFAMRQLSAAQADDLYELVSERQGRSLIITSNRAPSDWYPLFPNPVVAESLLDPLINTSHQVIMNGPSYRPNKRPKNPSEKGS